MLLKGVKILIQPIPLIIDNTTLRTMTKEATVEKSVAQQSDK